jgi:hypothetical protein
MTWDTLKSAIIQTPPTMKHSSTYSTGLSPIQKKTTPRKDLIQPAAPHDTQEQGWKIHHGRKKNSSKLTHQLLTSTISYYSRSDTPPPGHDFGGAVPVEPTAGAPGNWKKHHDGASKIGRAEAGSETVIEGANKANKDGINDNRYDMVRTNIKEILERAAE